MSMAMLFGALPRASAFAPLRMPARRASFFTRAVGLRPNGKEATTTPAVLLRGGLMGGSPLLLSTGAGVVMQAQDAGAKHVLVPIADGSEEMESVTIIDTLVRAGASVTVASVLGDKQVTCSRGVKIMADCKLEECEARDWDAVICPGGMPGATHLKESKPLEDILRKQDSDGKIIAAICASPAVVLASHGLLEGKKATCYPASTFTDNIPEHVDESVVVDGNTITSQGPATSVVFALQIVESLFGSAKAQEVGSGLLAL